MTEVQEKAKRSKVASKKVALVSNDARDFALERIAEAIQANVTDILSANHQDIAEAKKNQLQEALIDRLTLTEERLAGIVQSIYDVIGLSSPLQETVSTNARPNGLVIEEVRVPLGCIATIYEARPNVTVDIAVLSIKTGNSVILRGSTSTIHSNKKLVAIMKQALADTELPEDTISLIESPDREATKYLFHAKEFVDVIIPRGGKKLIDLVVRESSVPVIETGAGNCHMYVDESADVTLSRSVIVDAKAQRPSVCNALETLLVHKDWASKHLSCLMDDLLLNKVTVRGDERARAIDERIVPLLEDDFDTEFLSLTLPIKVVDSVEEAVDHIDTYGTKHSEAILSEDENSVVYFMNAIDAACVYHNASTRFTDGIEFGFGAEVGISTQKLHVRGPMGLPALTSTKYRIKGNGQTKAQPILNTLLH
ncbi:glutamate-5-semialdehyde dehydrogenase [Paenalkalicoccus suaedae]|uniref:Gamma-glutamyl phosphate reductase n=1 Tax=Paenalkalicoccus suaedae TaxID=2592382 RepID=A0A859FEI4_9BACI|nr:glutamate-5-semialdehyde dehydrogenase [Paenalkalicoccus suaedae]QKS71258.1 glutamate-5-semialdehyde dehydrogenase [Paenalkalicoccus suaedae]